MPGDLDTLLSDGLIDEVLGRLKTGKEAEVWLVRHGEEILAAKIYKERHVRSFKNNAGYKEGRQVRNSRTQRAIARGSKFGRESEEDAWKSAEADALYKLRAQGVRVPEPKAFYDGVLLMQLVVDGEGQPAPRLIDAHLTPEEASAAYADLRTQVVTMLCAELIHGDLSPYNVLLGARGPTLIDFPQVVGAAHNNLAETFFRRDLENLRTHFAAIDPSLSARASDAAEIWSAYVRRELSPDFVPTGRALPAPGRQREGGHQGRRRGNRPERAPGQAQGGAQRRPDARPVQGQPATQHRHGGQGRGGPQQPHQPPRGLHQPHQPHQPSRGLHQPNQPSRGLHQPNQPNKPHRGQGSRPAQGQQGSPRHAQQAPRPGRGRGSPRPGARPQRQGPPAPVVEHVQRTAASFAPRQPERRPREGEAQPAPQHQPQAPPQHHAQPQRPVEEHPPAPRREE